MQITAFIVGLGQTAAFSVSHHSAHHGMEGTMWNLQPGT